MALSQQRLDFIAKHRKDVIEATAGTGIFPSVKMAQMIIESADRYGVAGNGITARLANNYFGIKANSAWTGEKMAFNTPNDGQPVNYFRVYPTVKDSVIDHTRFLQVNPRYSAIFNAPSPAEQAILIEKAGYAEGAGYASKIAAMIKLYDLESLDREQQEVLKKKNNVVIALVVVVVVIGIIGAVYYYIKRK